MWTWWWNHLKEKRRSRRVQFRCCWFIFAIRGIGNTFPLVELSWAFLIFFGSFSFFFLKRRWKSSASIFFFSFYDCINCLCYDRVSDVHFILHTLSLTRKSLTISTLVLSVYFDLFTCLFILFPLCRSFAIQNLLWIYYQSV